MQAAATKVPEFRRRLAAIDSKSWPTPERVDYLLVRGAIDNVDFEHRVIHPWSSDPGFYVDQVQRFAYPDLPLQGDRLAEVKRGLESVPKTLAGAKINLTHGGREFAKLAIYNLDHADGVGHGMPYRSVPPAGTRGWYEDLIERAKKQQPELVPPAEKALAAVQDYQAWLKQHLAHMTAPSA